MKRIWALLLGVVLSVSLTACAENNLTYCAISNKTFKNL